MGSKGSFGDYVHGKEVLTGLLGCIGFAVCNII